MDYVGPDGQEETVIETMDSYSVYNSIYNFKPILTVAVAFVYVIRVKSSNSCVFTADDWFVYDNKYNVFE